MVLCIRENGKRENIMDLEVCFLDCNVVYFTYKSQLAIVSYCVVPWHAYIIMYVIRMSMGRRKSLQG